VILLWTCVLYCSDLNHDTDQSNKNNYSNSWLSQQFKDFLSEADASYKKYQQKRKSILPSPDKVNLCEPHTYHYDYFIAGFTCPLSTRRVGSIGDGRK